LPNALTENGQVGSKNTSKTRSPWPPDQRISAPHILHTISHIRRTRAHSLSAATPREGTMAHALARAHQAGIPPAGVDAFFASAMVVPVLTCASDRGAPQEHN